MRIRLVPKSVFPETNIIDLHFAAYSACLSSFEFYRQARKEYFISARVNVNCKSKL